MRVAVVGAGISGLTAALELARYGAHVTVYEKEERLGGSKEYRAAAVTAGDGTAVELDDIGFNAVAALCPDTVEFLEQLGVEMDKSSSSSISVSSLSEGGRPWGSTEWGTRNGLSGLFAQRSNALNPSFWRMLYEMLKFKRHVLKYLEDCEVNPDQDRDETLGQFIDSHGYSKLFQKAYLIPICASIWPYHSKAILGFSAFLVLSFCRNNQLLQLFNWSQCTTVKYHWRSYVNKVREQLMSMGCQIKTSCEVKSVSSFNGGHRLLGVDDSEEIYDRCIFGVNAHKTLKILGTEATNEELQILGSFQYVYSPTYLHRDKGLMPRNSSAWSSLNFLRTTNGDAFVTYWLNVLQNIGSTGTLLVTLNPPVVPDHFLLKWCTSHPVPSVTTAKATLELDEIQGKRGIWFCGAYQGYGFHEDGLKAGRAAAEGVARKNCCLFMNRRQIIPSWKEAGARLVVTRFLDQHITIGNLILLEEGGTMLSFGKTCAKCCVKSILRVHNPLFYWKVATEADLGLADAYINGLISFVDKQEGLLNLFLILIANRDAQKSTSSNTSKRGWWTPALTTAGVASAKYFLRHMSRKNTITQARRNISEHYDLSNDFFSLFLDPTMTYSCATFMMENESLEAAQLRKVGVLVEKAKVNQNHEVLEIGCGWGCFAIEVVKQTGCKYTGITLSEEQLKYSKRKVKESGLEDHVTFLLCDYRHVPSSHKYDRIISIEMVEAVGHEYMEDFFGCCESLLAEDGLLVLQFSSIPDTRYNEYRRSSEFLKEYVFPGLCVPCFSHIVSAMSAASRLCVEHVENIADNYCRTLTCWRDNLMANKDKIIALGFDEKLIRKFEYYFMYTASGFKSRTFEEYVIVFSRPGNRTAFPDPYASFPAA